jgi:hypothetical protein
MDNESREQEGMQVDFYLNYDILFIMFKFCDPINFDIFRFINKKINKKENLYCLENDILFSGQFIMLDGKSILNKYFNILDLLKENQFFYLQPSADSKIITPCFQALSLVFFQSRYK